MVQYFEPGDFNSLADNIVALYNDPQRLAELAANSDNFNQTYCWDSIAENYVSLVDALTETGRD